jgi:hypothetical protein
MRVTVHLPDDRPDLAIFAHRALNSLIANGRANCAYLYGEPPQVAAHAHRTKAGNVTVTVWDHP